MSTWQEHHVNSSIHTHFARSRFFQPSIVLLHLFLSHYTTHTICQLNSKTVHLRHFITTGSQICLFLIIRQRIVNLQNLRTHNMLKTPVKIKKLLVYIVSGNPICVCIERTTCAKFYKQEAQLSQRDCATHHVSCILVNCCTTVQKIAF